MSVAFWSVELKSGKPVEVQPPEGYVLNLQLAALAGEGKGQAVVKVETVAIEGDPINAVLCTLRSEKTEQTNLNLVFGYDVGTKFSFVGDAKSSVFLSGYYQPAPDMDDTGSDYSGESGSEGESGSDGENDEAPPALAKLPAAAPKPATAPAGTAKPAAAAAKPATAPAGSAKPAAAKPAAVPAKASQKDKIVVQDSGSEDDDDSDIEEDSVDEAFIKVHLTSAV